METNLTDLKYRMYGFVPYNLSEIQKGIQFGHAVVEYAQMARDFAAYDKVYLQWVRDDKTFIILNGGTTNTNIDKLGTLNQYANLLDENGVPLAKFHEPDLGDQLTAFVFLVDERVYDREKYPNYIDLPVYWDKDVEPELELYLKWDSDNTAEFLKWVHSLGGERNYFLRTFLSDKRLA